MRSLAPIQTDIESMPEQSSHEAAPPLELSLGDIAEREADRSPERAIRVIVYAGLASLVWLALAAAVIYLVARFQEPLTLTDWAGVAGGIAAPLSAIWLIALVLTRLHPNMQRDLLHRIAAAERRFATAAERTRAELGAIDGVLTAIDTRVQSMRAAIGEQTTQLLTTSEELAMRSTSISASLARDREAIDAVAERLTISSEGARAEFAHLLDTLPQADRQAQAIAAALQQGTGHARQQLGDIETLLAAVWTRNEEAQLQAAQATDKLTAAIAAIEAAAGTASHSLEHRTHALQTSVDDALNRTAETLEAARTGIEAQASALLGSVEQARTTLDGIGGEASRAIAKRLEKLAQQTEILTARLAAQDAQSRALVDTVERSFGVLDAKLANAAQSSNGTLDKLNERLAMVREQIHELGVPLAGTSQATREIEAAVAALHATTEQAIDALGGTLPDSVNRTTEATEAVRASIAALMGDVAQLQSGAARIALPIEDSRAAIDGAIAAFEAQRAAMEATVGGLNEQLATAKSLIEEVDAQADSTTLAATTKLVEAMTRVREVSQQSAGTMRATLEGVIAEAREALGEASAAALRASFAEPVQQQLAAVEAAGERSAAAAQAVAERMSRQLMMITETAASVENRVVEAEARLDAAARDDLSRRSALLLEALNSAAIDIAKVLSNDVSDTAWTAYLRGDRSIFTRRAVKLLDGSTTRAIAKHYETEPEFREQVRRYIHDFEAMMRRVMADREGPSLSVTLLSSDVGKLYVALAQAIDRLRS